MYSFPVQSVMQAPLADAIKTGVPPTARKARTGELTPPAIDWLAALKRDSEVFMQPFSIVFVLAGGL
jgi:hypothetical protein